MIFDIKALHFHQRQSRARTTNPQFSIAQASGFPLGLLQIASNFTCRYILTTLPLLTAARGTDSTVIETGKFILEPSNWC